MWTDEAFVNPKRVLAAVNPAISRSTVDRRLRPLVLEGLVDSGFYESQIDDPGSQ